MSKDLLEKLADLEHEQWIIWSKSVAREVHQTRRSRWGKYWIPYEDLPEEVKEQDRVWARKILELPEIKHMLELEEENAKLKKKIEYLWDLLDDIDTADDIAKDNDKLYRDLVRKESRKRFNVCTTDGYKLFHIDKPAAYITDDEDDGYPD